MYDTLTGDPSGCLLESKKLSVLSVGTALPTMSTLNVKLVSLAEMVLGSKFVASSGLPVGSVPETDSSVTLARCLPVNVPEKLRVAAVHVVPEAIWSVGSGLTM
jgi:hypothetical protein